MSNLYLYILKKYLFIPLHGVMCSGPIGPSFALHSLDITMTMIRLLSKKPRGVSALPLMSSYKYMHETNTVVVDMIVNTIVQRS